MKLQRKVEPIEKKKIWIEERKESVIEEDSSQKFNIEIWSNRFHTETEVIKFHKISKSQRTPPGRVAYNAYIQFSQVKFNLNLILVLDSMRAGLIL